MKNILIITKEIEKSLRFPYSEFATYYNWYWKDNQGNIGYLREYTEMGAIQRLREAFPEVGSITWISKNEYELLKDD